MEGATRDVKKRRASKPKVRTGCIPCKARRIKCDETKPECYKCQEYGSICAYQPLRSVPRDRSRHHDLVAIQPHPFHSPSNPHPYSETEARYHRLFHEKLAFDLSGYIDSPFWTRLIPQQCHQEPAIRDAVFALSALYKPAISSPTNTVNLRDEHVTFALVKQSRAISSLRKAINKGEPEMRRLALVGSLLFSCFESLQGRWEEAMQWVYNGVRIWRGLNEGERCSAAGFADVSLEVGMTFRRLEMQILSFLAMNPMLEHPFDDMMGNEITLDMPDQFATFQEAFTAATNLAVAIFRHLRTSARCGDTPTYTNFLQNQQHHLQERLSQWNQFYDLLFPHICQTPINRAYLGALQLRICMWKCEIMIATSLSDSESVYNNYTPEFQRITHFARHLLRTDQMVRNARMQYGMGVSMALFFAATRCRDGGIRREAIRILREWPAGNGIWHSLQAAVVAEWVVGLEERGVTGAVDGGKFIPEDGRVQLRSLKVVAEDGGMEVECLQYSGNGGLEPRRANLRWV
ncbi:putative UPC2 Regulatory involved in control of sterol uptake protein [Rutstroemia sp. NJR-2017a WRK4]|nr:putative UPC2 Regulatory involved in control of sterol uptake protein [Rutstroemia sp. NJR-2017a WRK4]